MGQTNSSPTPDQIRSDCIDTQIRRMMSSKPYFDGHYEYKIKQCEQKYQATLEALKTSETPKTSPPTSI